MPRWWNVANLLTASRLFLTPFIVIFLVQNRNVSAFICFFFAAWTDLLDGYAARRLNLSTSTGAYLDPIADKFLLSGIFLALAAAGRIPWWYVVIVFGRDLYILIGVSLIMLFTSARKFPPSVWGKASTFLQIGAAAGWMIPWPALEPAARAILWPSAAVTAWSGIHYTWRGIQVVRSASANPGNIDGLSARR